MLASTGLFAIWSICEQFFGQDGRGQCVIIKCLMIAAFCKSQVVGPKTAQRPQGIDLQRDRVQWDLSNFSGRRFNARSLQTKNSGRTPNALDLSFWKLYFICNEIDIASHTVLCAEGHHMDALPIFT